MATRTRQLDDLTWVSLAKGTNTARPVLTGVHVRKDAVEATDGHRLHIVPLKEHDKPLGVYELDGGKMPSLGSRIEGTYPNTSVVIPSFDWAPAVLMGERLRGARAVCKACVAMNRELRDWTACFVSLKTHSGQPGFFDARYLLDALSMWDAMPLQVFAPQPLNPCRIQDPNGARIAVVMPVRRATQGYERFSIDEFLTYARDQK